MPDQSAQQPGKRGTDDDRVEVEDETELRSRERRQSERCGTGERGDTDGV